MFNTSCNHENGIRIFDPMLFEDTVLSKIMKDFNTKCYVMNNEKKAFSIKTILGNFVFINEENKRKEIQGKNILSFTKFVLGGFCLGRFWLGRLLSGGLCPGGFDPDTKTRTSSIKLSVL